MMASRESGGQPRDVRGVIQARHGAGQLPRDAAAGGARCSVLPTIRPGTGAWARPLAILCVLSLAACADGQPSRPETWWHDAIGGKIAEQRPPPPGDRDAFPNLAAVPARPARPDAAAMNRMTAGLIADRIAANHAAALAPIPEPAARATAPLPPVREDAASASLAAMTRPPPPAGQGTAAAASPGKTAPDRTAPDKIAQDKIAPGAAPSSPGAGAPSAALPPGETKSSPPAGTKAPPAPGMIAAVAPPAVPVQAASATPAPPAPPLPSRPAPGLTIDFTLRSAALTETALEQLKAFAATRGERGIAVTGHGETAASDPLAQSDALTLALSRAQAVSTALAALGVPGVAIRLDAEAAGRGAGLRLLQ